MIREYRYSENECFAIEVIYSKRKSIGLEVRADGRVIARAPTRLSDRELVAFLEKHRKWVYDHLKKRRAQDREKRGFNFPDYDNLNAREKALIKAKLRERAEHYSKIMNVDFARLTVKNQKTRWGSCSSLGNLNFNYRLYYLPLELMDYVVVHELAHRKHMDHSKEFWSLVESVIPDYRERRKALKSIY